MRRRWFALFLMLVMPVALFAQTCAVPHPFDRTYVLGGTVAFVPGTGATCDLSTSVGATGAIATGAFAWYTAGGDRPTLRVSFRIDTSQLDETTVVDGVEILAVTSRHVAPGLFGNVLLHVGLVGGGPDATSPYLSYLAYCGICSEQMIVGTNPPIANGDLLRFEIAIGAGADGWVRYWRNADFSDPPTYDTGALDNAALLGSRDVALGAFNVATRLASVGTALRFSEIESSDEVLFWNAFDE
ncbi:MAG TPA: hypothetical protein VFV97_02000 [Rhodanobacteraceae bacterium]|nr:hypothetical protein [Rhodanobacteraceae bacterium]